MFRFQLSEPPPRPAPAELGLPLLPEIKADDEDAEDAKETDQEACDSKDKADGEALKSMQQGPNQNVKRPTSGVSRDFKTPAIDYLASGDAGTRRAFSALRALRKRLSFKLKQPENILVSDATLFTLAEKRPRKPEDLEDMPSGKRWAMLVSEHFDVNLLAFLKKHCPEEHVIEKTSRAWSLASSKASMASTSDLEREEKENIQPGATTQQFPDDLERYFSDDSAESGTENNYEEDDDDEDHDEDKDAFQTAVNSFSSVDQLSYSKAAAFIRPQRRF